VHIYQRPRYTTNETNICALIYDRRLEQSVQRLPYGLHDPRLESGRGKKLVSSPEKSRPVLGPNQPLIQLVLAFFPGSKAAGT
jgi:hypothetical protein